MQVTVNGSVRSAPPSLVELLDELRLQVGSVVVELNGTALLRSEVLTTTLSDGDVLELVRAVAGG